MPDPKAPDTSHPSDASYSGPSMQERHMRRAAELVVQLSLDGCSFACERDAILGIVALCEAVEGEVADAHNVATAAAIRERDELRLRAHNAEECLRQALRENERLTSQRDAALRAIADVQDAIADPDLAPGTKLAGIARAVRCQ